MATLSSLLFYEDFQQITKSKNKENRADLLATLRYVGGRF